MRHQGLKLMLVSSFMLLQACQPFTEGTTTGNPIVGFGITGSGQAADVTAKNLWQEIMLQLMPSAKALPPPNSMQDASGNTIVITSFWINISKIEFKFAQNKEDNENDGDEVRFAGPYPVDMLAASPTAIDMGKVSSAGMRRLKMKLTKTTSLPAGAPAGFLNKSVYIAGTINGSAFTYTTVQENYLVISGSRFVRAKENSNLLVEIHTANIFRSINLDTLKNSSNKNIDESNPLQASHACDGVDRGNSTIAACIRSAMDLRSNFGRDNGDWHLGGDDETVR